MPVKTTRPFKPYKDTILTEFEYEFPTDHYKHWEIQTKGASGEIERHFLDFSRYQEFTETLYHMYVDLGCPTRVDIPSNGTLYPEDIEIAWTKRFRT